MAGRPAAAGPAQDVDVVLQDARTSCSTVTHASARRGELDRQRNAVDRDADAGDGGGVVVGEIDAGIDRPGALEEQLHRRERQ